MKPVIAITANYSYDDSIGTNFYIGALLQQWNLIAQDYILAVENAGGIPVIIPVYNSLDNAKEYLNKVDGIIFSGGADINPMCYSEEIVSQIGTVTYNRDVQEIELMKYLLEKTEIAILGICRGHQILNVAMGGQLVSRYGSKRYA